MAIKVKAKIINCLEKVFENKEPICYSECEKLSGFKNETISFQVAYSAAYDNSSGLVDNFARIAVHSPIKDCVRVRLVEQVPVGLATFQDADADYLRVESGLFPDRLVDLADGANGHLRVNLGRWNALWIDVQCENAGKHPIEIVFKALDETVVASVCTDVEILNALLPEQKLIRTNWFHADCLANYYNVSVFSERHWEIVENFVKLMVERGWNMLLTPNFTPPLDTAKGGERLTVQLVDVTVCNEKYCFGYEKFDRWVAMCDRCGVQYFEISHLFSQWGAFAAPKIMATIDGEYKQLFGWETKADGEEYSKFIGEYLTSFVAHIQKLGIEKRCYFHISDEPFLEHLESYTAAKNLAAKYLDGFEIIDALSDFAFYQKGILTKPIPANNHIEPFIKAGVENLWTYYCVGQYKDVSNWFIAMPGQRTRILATQLYKYKIEGFLQWGYNFYNAQYSTKPINPYETTDADGFVPGGDAFQVYPGKDGKPVESMRFMYSAQIAYDLRAFKLLESLTNREFVLSLMEEEISRPITFSDYPRSASYLLMLRNRVNTAIMKHLAK